MVKYKRDENMLTIEEKLSRTAKSMDEKIKKNDKANCMLALDHYRFLSETQTEFISAMSGFLKSQNYSTEKVEATSEDDVESVEFIKDKLGYFIAPDNLFSSWIESGIDFDVSNVRDAMHALTRQSSSYGKRDHGDIIETLMGSLKSLGATEAEKSRELSRMIYVIENSANADPSLTS